MRVTGGSALEAAPPVSRGSALFGQLAGIFAVVFIGYSLGAVAAWKAFGSELGPAFFYPPAGITVAAMMLSRRSRWAAVVAAIVLGELMVDMFFGNTAGVALGYSLANVVEPLFGASVVLAWCGGIPDLRRRRDLIAFGTGACVIGPGLGGLVGGTTAHLYDHSSWVADVLHWWVGDALGVLVVATPILLWRYQSGILRNRPWETAAVLTLTTTVSVAAFWATAPPSILILPFLAWAALRLDILGAALAGGAVAFVTTLMTSRAGGAFRAWDAGPANNLVLTQLWVAVVMTVGLLIAQEASARIKAVAEREIERRERHRLEVLASLGQHLAAALTPDDIGRALRQHLLSDTDARAGNLGVLNRDGTKLEWIAMVGYSDAILKEFGSGVNLDEQLVATDAARSGQPVLVPSALDYERRYGDGVRWLHLNKSQAIAGLPLEGGGKPYGVLVLMWAEPQPFDSAQRAYLSAVATMVSQALSRARIYADEHARAAILQSALVPDSPVETHALDVWVAYEPADVADALGGDWYDVMPLEGGGTYLAVGDVIGHGLPAVEDMAQLRSAGRTLAYQGLAPDQLFAILNRFTRHSSQGKFATMAVAFFDPDTSVLTYSRAGHPPPVLRRAISGEVVLLAEADGPVLGPLADSSYAAGSTVIHADDVLVMYTDGLVEHRGVDIGSGIADLRRMVSEWGRDTELSRGCAALLAELAPHPRGDDVCVIAVRFAPAAPTHSTSASMNSINTRATSGE